MSNLHHRIRTFRHWHARIGVMAALFLVLMIVSGVALNHTDQLKLALKPVKLGWLATWYGLKRTVPSQGYRLKGEYVVWDSTKWVIGTRVLVQEASPPVGAAEVDGIRFIATPSRLYLFLPDGRLVEKMDGSALPSVPVLRLGVTGAEVVLKTAKGNFASADGADWRPIAGEDMAWSAAEPLPATVRSRMNELFEPALSLERILLDVHSGRILGRYGPLLVDAIALVLFGLALSGLWIYFRTVRRRPR